WGIATSSYRSSSLRSELSAAVPRIINRQSSIINRAATEAMPLSSLDLLTATAILGSDILWGGDVMNPSGTGRFIADSWFSDETLPEAYTHPAAKKVRESGGVSAKEPDRAAIEEYLHAVDVKGAIDAMAAEGRRL